MGRVNRNLRFNIARAKHSGKSGMVCVDPLFDSEA